MIGLNKAKTHKLEEQCFSFKKSVNQSERGEIWKSSEETSVYEAVVQDFSFFLSLFIFLPWGI